MALQIKKWEHQEAIAEVKKSKSYECKAGTRMCSSCLQGQ